MASLSYSMASRISNSSCSTSSSVSRTLCSASRAFSILLPLWIYLVMVRIACSEWEITKSDLPTRAAGNSRQEDKDQSWNQKLENDNQLPVPLAQLRNILGTGKVNPEADE